MQFYLQAKENDKGLKLALQFWNILEKLHERKPKIWAPVKDNFLRTIVSLNDDRRIINKNDIITFSPNDTFL